MCILCGEFVMQIHWTDKTSTDETEILVGDLQRTRMRTRLHRAKLCNKILSYYRLKLEDWHGSKFVLRDLKGNQEIVHDLGALWGTAEKMLGGPINPLDPNLLQQIQEEQNLLRNENK
ncbi:hypothetical protein [Paenisporosarcina sp. TG20]|uniref:hypothetical protein n=1 Tax=Paenisporosarcina sp. TG20 TaxID=1211706 RepID=UPI0003647971|nr:hypothetical protein [Paenisporosarcina sp. TG20]